MPPQLSPLIVNFFAKVMPMLLHRLTFGVVFDKINCKTINI